MESDVLKAVEEISGYTPNEMLDMYNDYGRMAKEWEAYAGTGLAPEEIAHAKDLLSAEKDGRCVVLPCKVGDTVFTIGNVSCSDCPHGEGNYSAYLHCHQPKCPKAVLEHICEGYEIGQNGLSNPGEWGFEGLETFALPDDSGSGCYYARAEAEKALEKEAQS